MIIVNDYNDNECKMLINVLISLYLQICIYFGNIIIFDCKKSGTTCYEK